ncbi:substrate-binding periplasmic protein [Oligoflexus tunisiensis]|uniref:substrate-binding periplasmic protein n=1 Tax=Oligoflexus tunisiensis TaxID=708132 RepID=UPI00114CC55B|nr:transporter substrate-binding domain-containing protein [Oligoflexus tunisiensis]
MRWISGIFTGLLLLFPFLDTLDSRAEEKRSLDVGLIEFNSLATIEGQQADGLIVEYARDILLAANLPLQYQAVSIGRSLEQLRSNRLDLVLMLFRTPERAAYTRYSRLPLLWLNVGVCTRTELHKQPLASSSRLVHVRGALLPSVLRDLPRLPVSGENAQLRMLQMLLKNRVDAIYTPKPEALLLAAHQAGIEAALHCYEFKNIRMAMHLGFARNLPADVVQRLEDALQKKLQTESFENFLERRLAENGIASPPLELIDPMEILP